jgi:hypothetical protein
MVRGSLAPDQVNRVLHQSVQYLEAVLHPPVLHGRLTTRVRA